MLHFVFCRNNFNIHHLSLILFILLITEFLKCSEFSYKSGNLQYTVRVQNLGNIVRVFWNYISLFLRNTALSIIERQYFPVMVASFLIAIPISVASYRWSITSAVFF